jgi:hypothetical protein
MRGVRRMNVQYEIGWLADDFILQGNPEIHSNHM